MDLAVLIVGIMGLIIAVIALPKEKWERIPKIGKDIRYWLKTRKCFYTTKIYLAESEQTDKRAYVYVGKSRKLLADMLWKFSEWFGAIWIRLRSAESPPIKFINSEKLGVIQVLAVYCSQSHQWKRVPPLYLERLGTTLVVTSNLEFVRPPSARYYDPETGEDQWERYHDWHKPVICLLPDSSSLCRDMKVKLKDLKGEYKLSFTSPSGKYNMWRSGASWKWEQRES